MAAESEVPVVPVRVSSNGQTIDCVTVEHGNPVYIDRIGRRCVFNMQDQEERDLLLRILAHARARAQQMMHQAQECLSMCLVMEEFSFDLEACEDSFLYALCD